MIDPGNASLFSEEHIATSNCRSLSPLYGKFSHSQLIRATEVQSDIAHYLKQIQSHGFFEVVRFDRMLDDLQRIPIRRVTELIEQGKVISKTYHRSWIMPGGVFFDQDILSKTLAENFHTPETIEAFQVAMAKSAEAFEAGLNGEKIIEPR